MSFAPTLNQTCQLITNTRNRYGDYILSSTASVSCWFRQIDLIQRSSHAEEINADAQVWFAAGTSVEKGQLVLFANIVYQIDKINFARTPFRTGIQFIKCDLKITDQGIS